MTILINPAENGDSRFTYQKKEGTDHIVILPNGWHEGERCVYAELRADIPADERRRQIAQIAQQAKIRS